MTAINQKLYDMENVAKSNGFKMVVEDRPFESRIVFSKDGVNVAIVRDYFDEAPNELVMRRVESFYKERNK